MGEGRARKRLERWLPLALVTLLAIPALAPLLHGELLCTHDNDLHYHRLIALRHAIENGSPFSRWTPGLAFGYGYPFFNYRGALGYYLGELYYLLGLGIPAALNLTYALSLLAAGWGAYLLGRDLWRSSLAGILVSVAYMYAPYQFIDSLYRGNLPESVALGLFPFILWLFVVYLQRPRPITLTAAALSVTLLFLSHNISSLLFAPFLGLALLVLAWAHRAGLRTTLYAVGALGLGFVLAGFYWLPAVLEQDMVTLFMSYTTRNNDFHFNFPRLGEILAPPFASDASLINPPLTIPLGLPLALLAVIGLVVAWRGRSKNRIVALFFAVAAAGYLFLATPASVWLWENLPLVRFVQFPWRLIGRATLPAAVLVGALVPALPRRWWVAVVLAAISILVTTALPWLYPTRCPAPAFPELADLYDYERETGLVGVDPEGSYFPRWVAQRPSGSPMEAALRAGGAARRFDLGAMPEGARLLGEVYGPNRAEIELESPVPFQALYHTFYFPGWVAGVDGELAPINPTEPEGLISFLVPAGRHTVTIRWEPTPLRRLAAGLSLLAAVGLSILALTARRFRGERPVLSVDPAPAATMFWIALLGVALLGFKLVVDAERTPLRQPRLEDSVLVGLEHQSALRLADGLQLLGYQLDPAPAGSEFRIDLAWTTWQRPAGDYAARIALVDSEGMVWSAKETYRPRGYQPYPPTAGWQTDKWVWDSHSVPILPGTPAGRYLLKLTVFDRSTLAPLNVLDAAGQVAGPDAIIGEVEINRPDRPPASLPMQYTSGHRWEDLTLLGFNLDRGEAAPGDPALITLFWQAEASLPPMTAHLRLVDPAGLSVGEWERPLVRADAPPSTWRPRDPLTGQHLVQVPGRAEDGRHTWQLGVRDVDGEPIGQFIVLGELTVTAPDRVWTPPSVAHAVGADYALGTGEPFAELVGYRLEDGELHPGQSAALDLVWLSRSETETSYRVYLHLLAPDGRIVAQSDGVPAGWTRPTPGWAPGEYLLDPHTLVLPADLPPGSYTLAAGFYDLATGDRLQSSQAAIGSLTVR